MKQSTKIVLVIVILLACNVMHPMLEEVKKEFQTPGRKFTFLCGHDSTILGVAAALHMKDYELPGTISQKTPIGGKMVFEKYRGPDGRDYMKVSMCYNTTSQLRDCAITSLGEPPMLYDMEFEELTKNADGYYLFDDVMDRFDEAISIYYEYLEEEQDEAA